MHDVPRRKLAQPGTAKLTHLMTAALPDRAMAGADMLISPLTMDCRPLVSTALMLRAMGPALPRAPAAPPFGPRRSYFAVPAAGSTIPSRKSLANAALVKLDAAIVAASRTAGGIILARSPRPQILGTDQSGDHVIAIVELGVADVGGADAEQQRRSDDDQAFAHPLVLQCAAGLIPGLNWLTTQEDNFSGRASLSSRRSTGYPTAPATISP